MFRTLFIASILFGLGLAWSPAADAGNYTINPTRVVLDAEHPSTLLTLSNRGDEELRFQLSEWAWNQSELGEMKLESSEDLVVFPTLFIVPPGATKTIRVGTTTELPASEVAYRLYIEELPPIDEDSGSTGVRVLARMGVPIFLAPHRPRVSGEISDVSVQDGLLSMRILNLGTTHVMLQDVAVTAVDGGGHTVWERHRPDWYLLAGGIRDLDVELPAEDCDRIASLEIKVVTDRDTWTRHVEDLGESCRQ